MPNTPEMLDEAYFQKRPNINSTYVIFGAVLVSAFPLVFYFRKFMKLFWFADEIALLHEWSQIGFSRWLLTSFGENISPVYKLIWGGIVLASGGDYDYMLLFSWVIHLIAIFLFIHLLLNHSADFLTAFFAASLVGISASSHYLLTMSYHVNAGLCLSFALSALLIQSSDYLSKRPFICSSLYLLLLTCSVLSFTRGMVFASAFSLYWFLRFFFRRKSLYLVSAGLSLVPVAITLILLLSNGDTTNKLSANFTADISGKLSYAFVCFALNPLYGVLNLSDKAWNSNLEVGVFAIIKLSIALFALMQARKQDEKLFSLFVALFAFDIAHSLLLGYGRVGEGLPASVVPRYQRAFLFSFTPLLAFTFYSLTERLIHNLQTRTIVRSVIVTTVLLYALEPWQTKLKHQVKWQGNMGREALLSSSKLDQKWHGIPPNISTQEAREAAKYFSFKP